MQSVREPIVQIIYEVIGGAPPLSVSAEKDMPNARLATQLIADGYLQGRVVEDEHGRPLQVTIMDVTIAGRRLCDELEREIRESRPGAKAVQTIKKGTILLLGGLSGVLGGVIGAVLTAFILRKMDLE